MDPKDVLYSNLSRDTQIPEVFKEEKKDEKENLVTSTALSHINSLVAPKNPTVDFEYQAKPLAPPKELTLEERDYIEKVKSEAYINAKNVLENIQKFGITDQKALIEIAKIVALQSGRGISKFIQNFGITDQKALIEIAKIAAAQSGRGVAKFIQNYGLKDREDLFEVLSIALRHSGLDVLNILDKSILSAFDEKKRIILTLAAFAFSLFNKTQKELEEFYPLINEFILPNETINSKIKSEELLYICLDKKGDSIFEGGRFAPVIQKICKYRGKEVRGFLLGLFIQEAGQAKYQRAYEKLTGYSKGNFLIPRILLSIIPSKWIAEGNLSLNNEEIEKLIGVFQDKRNILKDNFHSFSPTFLLAAKNLELVSRVGFDRKFTVLLKVCKEEEALKLVACFAARQQADLLNTLKLEEPLQELKSAFQENLVRSFSSFSIGAEDLINKYNETFAKMRVSFALEIYEGTLRFSEPIVKETLNKFIKSVILGTFEDERFETDNNKHLEKIKTFYLDIFNSWKSLTFENEFSLEEKSHLVTHLTQAWVFLVVFEVLEMPSD